MRRRRGRVWRGGVRPCRRGRRWSRGQAEGGVEAGQAGGQDAADGEVGVGGGVEALDLGVGLLGGGAGDQAERGLPVLQAPAAVRAGPAAGDQAQVAGDGRGAEGEQGGQLGEHPGQERLGLPGEPVRTGATVAEVAAVAPQAEVQVAAVADAVGGGDGGEAGAQAVPQRDGLHGVPDQQGGVGGLDRAFGGDGQLVLALGVLGVQLEDGHPLFAQGAQQVAQVVAVADQAAHAVRGPGFAAVDDPLDLDAGPDGQAVSGERLGGAAGELPLAAGVRFALLGAPVAGGPGPAGLGGEAVQRGEVGDQAQVADGAAGGGERVVDQEGVEAGRGADAPAGGGLQAADRDGLDPGDARVVDPADDDPVDALGLDPGGGRPGLGGVVGGRRGDPHGPILTRAFRPIGGTRREVTRPWPHRCDAGHIG